MQLKDFNNIKERYKKTSIVASDEEHKIIKVMQDDIRALIACVEQHQAMGTKPFGNVYEVIGSV